MSQESTITHVERLVGLGPDFGLPLQSSARWYGRADNEDGRLTRRLLDQLHHGRDSGPYVLWGRVFLIRRRPETGEGNAR